MKVTYQLSRLNDCCTTMILLSSVVLLMSCNVLSRSLAEEEGFPTSHSQPDMDRRTVSAPSIYSNGCPPGAFTVNPGMIDYTSKRSRIGYLEYMKYTNPDKSEKYNQLIQEEYAKTADKKDEILNGKHSFLKQFYTDLYNINSTAFTLRYEDNCNKYIRAELKAVYKLNHGKEGYSWAIFGDNEMHIQQDITITNVDWKELKDESDKLFGKRNKYIWNWYEYDWFKISMGKNYVIVKVDEKHKNYRISRLLNPKLKIAI